MFNEPTHRVIKNLIDKDASHDAKEGDFMVESAISNIDLQNYTNITNGTARPYRN